MVNLGVRVELPVTSSSHNDPDPSDYREFQNVYSPGTLLGVYAAALRTPVEGRMVLARGIFQGSPVARMYNDYYYDSIRSVYENKVVKARIPAVLRNKLENNQVYLFKGYVEKKVTLSAIELQFVVDEVLQREENNISQEEIRRFELVQQKLSKGYRDFEKLVRDHVHRGQQPRIMNIYGNAAIVHKDFEKGLAEACTRFAMSEHRCNFSSKKEIIQTLHALAGADVDAVALVRGGGDPASLDIFNDPEIGAAALKLKPLLITALGHTVNHTLADRLADHKFALPHDYGNKLKEWVDSAVAEQNNSKSLFIDQVKKDLSKTYDEQIATLQKQLDLRNRENAAAQEKFRELGEQLRKDQAEALAAREAAFTSQLRQKDETLKALADQFESTAKEKINAATIEIKTRFTLLEEENRKLTLARRRSNVLVIVIFLFALICLGLLIMRR